MYKKFIELWKKYFNDAELPITFYYTDEEGHAELAKPDPSNRCLIEALSSVRHGKSYSFDTNSIGCFGGKWWVGFSEKIVPRPNFEYFLSCGIPGKLEGERYKKSPEIVLEIMKKVHVLKAPARYIVFKRWDKLEESDNPEVVIFFTQPDVLSGLFTLANFDCTELNGVITPMSSGCGSIVHHPYLEKDKEKPRGIIGMFDPSARPYVHENELTFAIPIKRFLTMIDNMEESFLITKSWNEVRQRIR
jgi:uncharacterized protein (DUF169 family)